MSPKSIIKQQGVAIIATLMVVVVVSVLGVSIIQRTLSAAKVSNSLLDIEAACLSAESALRVGEAFIENDVDGWAQYLFSEDDVSDWYKADWTTISSGVQTVANFTNVSGATGTSGMINKDPEFRLELYEHLPIGGANGKQFFQDYFRVTAQGYGRSSAAVCKRQSVVVKLSSYS